MVTAPTTVPTPKSMSYPAQLKSAQQVAAAPRSKEVEDSFYTHFLYEMLNQVVKNYDARALHRNISTRATTEDASRATTSSKPDPSVPEDGLKQEIEQLGAELGKRTSDQLALG